MRNHYICFSPHYTLFEEKMIAKKTAGIILIIPSPLLLRTETSQERSSSPMHFTLSEKFFLPRRFAN
jgi:hypothetical protein